MTEKSMQLIKAKFTTDDLAKYPFLKKSADYIKKIDLKIEDLNFELEKILTRAEERITEAMLYALVSRKLEDKEVEIASFPVSVILAIATKNAFIRRRYALAEAKQAYSDIKLESIEKIFVIAKNFNWTIEINDGSKIPYDFKLFFKDYLRNSINLQEKEWKLVNRFLENGFVYLSKDKIARLLSEEIRRHIESRLTVNENLTLPTKIMDIVERIKALSTEIRGKPKVIVFPQKITSDNFPPCIAALYAAASSGRHISHIGRFTLTAFLINIGMSSEKVDALFRRSSDYNEKIAKYQIEHISGKRGSRTRYLPPKCLTLQTHRLCINPNELCEKIRSPLAYYREKIKSN
jgi:DNA primase large subunit